MPHFIIYDCEYTTWAGALARDWTGPGEFPEVVQIGAMRFDAKTLECTGAIDLFVKPVKCPQLSDYFIDLTGITQQQVNDNGRPFADALAQFRDFIADAPVAAYGLDDKVIRRNQALHGMAEDFHSHNIGPWFMENGAAYGVKPGVNSGALARTVGAAMEKAVAEHNALEDVRSIITAYKFLTQKGAPHFFS